MTSEGDKTSTQESTWKHIEGVLTGIATVIALAGLLYPLGLIALWVQIFSTYSNSFAVAWHAATLVPRTTTIAQAGWLLFEQAVFFLPLIYLFMRFLFGKGFEKSIDAESSILLPEDISRAGREYYMSLSLFRMPASHPMRRRFRRIAPIVAIVVIAIGTFMTIRDISNPLAAFFTAIGTIAMMFSLMMIIFVLLFRLRDASPLRRRLTIVVIAYAGLVAMAIFWASQYPPNLPFVELNRGDATRLQGKLLNHTEGFWYVLVEPTGDIKAIPDRTVNAVTITSAP